MCDGDLTNGKLVFADVTICSANSPCVAPVGSANKWILGCTRGDPDPLPHAGLR